MKVGQSQPNHSGPVDPDSHSARQPDGASARARAGGAPGYAPGTGVAHVARGGSSSASFAGHYGQLILTDGVAPIPRALYLYQGALNLSPQQVWFISCVLSHKWYEGLPHPRLQELARHATLSLRQIKNIKNSLLQAALLEVTPRYGTEGEQEANNYDFGMLFEKLENAIAAAPDASAGGTAPEDALADGTLGRGGEQVEGETYIYCSDRGVPELITGGTDEADGADGADGSREGVARDYSFAARFGRVVLRRGVVPVPRALFTYQAEIGLSPQQLWFIGYILSFQWSTELPYPSLRKMAQNTGYSERQIHRIKDDLVRAGHLRLIERRSTNARGNGNTTSAYDFSELLRALNALIRRHASGSRGKPSKMGRDVVTVEQSEKGGKGEDNEADNGQNHSPGLSHQPPHHPPPDSMHRGGEASVSGGVKSTSVGGVPDVIVGGEASVSGGGEASVIRIEEDKEEEDKEEHQQQPPDEIDEAKQNAYYTLVDVGVIPDTAYEFVTQLTPDHILRWVRYYLSVLSMQKSLDNPLGVLVKRLRSGDEPPYLPSQGELQSMRLHMGRFNN